jgi:hypothetical protein
MATREDIVKAFNLLVHDEVFPWKGMWISEDEWANYIQPDSTVPLEKRRKDFNTALRTDEKYKNLLDREIWWQLIGSEAARGASRATYRSR